MREMEDAASADFEEGPRDDLRDLKTGDEDGERGEKLASEDHMAGIGKSDTEKMSVGEMM